MWGRCRVGRQGGGRGECLGVGTPGGEGGRGLGGRVVWCLVTAVGDVDGRGGA